jgi:hypothetical protein
VGEIIRIHTGRKEQGYKGKTVETQQGAVERKSNKVTKKIIRRGYREDGEEDARVGEGLDDGLINTRMSDKLTKPVINTIHEQL